MAARGRKPIEEEFRLRERIESFYLSGMRPVEIRDALASPQNVAPLELSLRQVQAYVRSIGKGWVKSLDPARREAELAELVADTKDLIRTSASASARYRDSSLGVGYLNSRLKGIDRLAKLLGLYDPAPSYRGGSAPADAHPFESLTPAEQAVHLHRLLDIIEETR